MTTPVKFLGARKFKHTCHIQGLFFTNEEFDEISKKEYYGPTYDGTIYLSMVEKKVQKNVQTFNFG